MSGHHLTMCCSIIKPLFRDTKLNHSRGKGNLADQCHESASDPGVSQHDRGGDGIWRQTSGAHAGQGNGPSPDIRWDEYSEVSLQLGTVLRLGLLEPRQLSPWRAPKKDLFSLTSVLGCISRGHVVEFGTLQKVL